jgi:predicted RNA-binding protein
VKTHRKPNNSTEAQAVQYWLVVTSFDNFRHDRDVLGFQYQGLPHRFRKQVQRMRSGDRVVYYVMGAQKFGAIATVTGPYFEDNKKLWTNDDEMWPSRCSSRLDFALGDDELLDAKKLIDDLSFIENKKNWGAYFQGSVKQIPEADFKLIESEIRKIAGDRVPPAPWRQVSVLPPDSPKTEGQFEKAIMDLPLQAVSLHDRIGEMLEQIGSWMDYNTQTRHKITPDHAYQLDVAWLNGRNPEIAIEVQDRGNITEAKDRLAQARKFNYRKVIMVLKQNDIARLNQIMKHEPDLRSWMEAWSIGAVYTMYMAGERFFAYYKQLKESTYKDKSELMLVE